MKNINLKRFSFVFFILAITFGIVYTFNFVNLNQNVEDVNALPSTNKVIVIDARHRKPDEG